MRRSTRRTHAALSVAVAAATGTVLALNGIAQAATPADAPAWPASGTLLYGDSSAFSGTVGPWRDEDDSEAPDPLPGSGAMPAWSPNGARLVTVSGDNLITERHDGTDVRAISDGTLPDPANPTFWKSGRAIAFASHGHLASATSDGLGDGGHVDSVITRIATPQDGGVCDDHPTGGMGGTLYFQRTTGTCDGGGTTAVYRYDDATGTVTEVIDDASSPSLSQDGTKLAFLRTVDGHVQVFTAATDGTGVRQLTTDTDHPYGPETWAPDGKSITDSVTGSFGQGDDGTPFDRELFSIDATTGTPTAMNYYTWIHPAYQPLRTVDLVNVNGKTASDSNIRASRLVWNTVGQHGAGQSDAKSAVIVSDADPVDGALTPGLAGVKHGPVLLTSATSLDTAVQTELKRVLAKGSTVYLVGGPSVLNAAVATKATALGYKVARLSGSTRYATSLAVAKAITPKPGHVFAATGSDYHSVLDAEGAIAAGAGDGRPTVAVYTDGTTLTSDVTGYLTALEKGDATTDVRPIGTSARTALENHGLGGHGEINGSGNSGTSVAMAKSWYHQPEQVAFSDDASWKGGVTTVAAMARFGPVLWTSATSLDDGDKTYLTDESAALKYTSAFAGELWANTTLSLIRDASGPEGTGRELGVDPDGTFHRPTDTAPLAPFRAPMG